MDGPRFASAIVDIRTRVGCCHLYGLFTQPKLLALMRSADRRSVTSTSSRAHWGHTGLVDPGPTGHAIMSSFARANRREASDLAECPRSPWRCRAAAWTSAALEHVPYPAGAMVAGRRYAS